MTAADAIGGFSRGDLLRVYRETRTIAVVGASDNPEKPAHEIPAYLRTQGYRIIPVNPRGGEMFGEPVAESLSVVSGRVDVVDVFRPPADAEGVARAAVGIGAKVLWFQPGTHTPEAVALARVAGLEVFFGICMGKTHAFLGLDVGLAENALGKGEEGSR
jgi:hypothetical protein